MKKQRRKTSEKVSPEDEAIMATISERLELQSRVGDYWCSVTGRDTVDRTTFYIIFSHFVKFGADRFLPWVDSAYLKTNGGDEDMSRYISGIIRNLTDEELNEY